MKYLMLVVRLLDMLTGSGLYELTRYSNGTSLNLSTSKFMAWRRRTARRLWSLEAMQLIVPFIIIGILLFGMNPLLIGASGVFLVCLILIIVLLIVIFPPIAFLLA